jgi:PAS domain S-box-containing protein
MSGRVPSSGRVNPRPVAPHTAHSHARDGRDALMDRVPAILYISEAGEFGVWHYVSPQIEAILGFTPEEWCVDFSLWASRLHPDDRASVIDFETDVVAGMPPVGASEYRLLHRDGHVVWVRDDALLVVEEDGTKCWHGVITDITEAKEAQAELERRAAQQAAVARLGEHALEGASISDLMQDAITAAAQLVNADLAAVIELIPDREAFVLRSAYGLKDNRVNETIPGGRKSQAGYTIASGGAVTVTDWETETRFECSPVLASHGVRCGITVVIEGRLKPFARQRARRHVRAPVDRR